MRVSPGWQSRVWPWFLARTPNMYIVVASLCRLSCTRHLVLLPKNLFRHHHATYCYCHGERDRPRVRPPARPPRRVGHRAPTVFHPAGTRPGRHCYAIHRPVRSRPGRWPPWDHRHHAVTNVQGIGVRTFGNGLAPSFRDKMPRQGGVVEPNHQDLIDGKGVGTACLVDRFQALEIDFCNTDGLKILRFFFQVLDHHHTRFGITYATGMWDTTGTGMARIPPLHRTKLL